MADRPRQHGRQRPVQRLGGSAGLRDQTRAYRALRTALLAAEPLCRYCRAAGHITPAAVVDHIIALSLGGSNDRGNLAPACRPCNDAKATIERRFAARRYDVRDILRDPDLADWIVRGRTMPD